MRTIHVNLPDTYNFVKQIKRNNILYINDNYACIGLAETVCIYLSGLCIVSIN